MSVITPSATLMESIAECTVGQARYDMQESSDATGHQAARLFGPPRWRMALRTKDGFSLQDAGQWESVLLQLRGGVNHLALYDIMRAQPQGTLRGSPTLGSTAAAGATSLTLAGARSQNLLVGGGFEADANVDSVADGWSLYVSSGSPAAAGGLTTGNGSAGAQVLNVTDLTVGDAGFVTSAYAPVDANNGYSFSVDVSASSALFDVTLRIAWYTAGSSFISANDATHSGATAWTRRAVYAVAPPTATKCIVYVWLSDLGAPVAFAAYFDNAQLEAGAPTDFTVATLKAGDWLQLGTGLGTSQLVKVVSDATGTDAQAMTVTIEPPLRQQFASTTAVTWDKPIAYYKQTGAPQWSYRPGRRIKQAGFAIDALESWS